MGGDNRTGPERRQNWTACPLHEGFVKSLDTGDKRMEKIEAKIDRLIEGQSAQALKIQSLTDSFEKNLSIQIREAVAGINALESRMGEICTSYETRLSALESFSWFRNWMNKTRDNLLKYLIEIAFAGALLYLFIEFGEKILKRALS